MLKKSVLSHKEYNFRSSIFQRWMKNASMRSIWTGLLGKDQLVINLIALLLGRAVMFSQLAPFALAYFIALHKLDAGKSFFALVWISIGYYSSLGLLATTTLCLSIAVFLGFERFFLSKYISRRWHWGALAFLSNFCAKLPWLLVRTPFQSEILSLIIESSLVAVLMLIFQGGLSVLTHQQADKTVSSEELICISLLLAGCLSGMHALSVGQVSLEKVFINFLLMYIALCGGSHLAATAGLLLALIANISEGIILSRLGFYCFIGLLAGLCKEYKRVGVIVCYLLSHALLSYYHLGATIWLTMMPEVCIAGLGLLLLPKAWLEQSEKLVARFRIDKGFTADEHINSQQVMTQQIDEFSDIFTSLAEIFQVSPQKDQVLVQDYQPVLDRLCQAVCGSCALSRRCWQDDRIATTNALLEAISLTERRGTLKKSYIGDPIYKRCLYLDRIVEYLNQMLEIHRLNNYWQKRVSDNNQLVAVQLKGIAGIVKDLAHNFHPKGNEDQLIAIRLLKAFSELQIAINDIQVVRSDGDKILVTIHKPSCQGKTHCNTVIVPMISKILGKKVTRTDARCATLCGDKECVLRLTTEPTYEVICGIAQIAANGHQVSGDSYAFFELPGGKYAVLLSDGMGSGSRARQESDITIRVLQKVLETGFSKDTAIKTINTVLALHSAEETFATVDLVLIDLYSANAEFVKIGASMTVCKRGNNVQMIQSSSLPAGVFCDIIPDEYEFLMAVDDILVMISDGVLESQREVHDKEGWLRRVVTQAVGRHPQDIADYIIQQARQNCHNKIVDDMTVMVLLLRKGNAGVLLRSA